MNNIKSIFLTIDRSLFSQISQLKNGSLYQKWSDLTRDLPEGAQKVVNQFVTLFLISLPLIPSIFIYIKINNTKIDNQAKKAVFESIKKYQAVTFEAEKLARSLPKTKDIQDKASFDKALSQMLSSTGIEASKVKVGTFHAGSESLVRSDVNLIITQFTASDLESFLQSWTTRYRAKISKINLKKDTKSNLMFGEIELVLLGQKKNENKK